MKYASAMRFGGSLVEAVECDYEDYKYLGLLCPECKDPVFLRAEGTRQQNGKEVKIGAHFCHFPGKDLSLVKQCEQRVSKYSDAEIQRAIAKARGQRLRLLQRWFWSVFKTHSFLFDQAANGYGGNWDDMLGDDPEFDWYFDENGRYTSTKETTLKGFSMFESFFRSFVDSQDKIENLMMELKKSSEGAFVPVVKTYDSGLLTRSQLSITSEVAKYLCSKSARDTLLQLFLIENYYNFNAGRENDWDDASDLVPSRTTHSILVELFSIPWADEFAKLQKQSVKEAA